MRKHLLSLLVLLVSLLHVNSLRAQVISNDPTPYCTVSSAYDPCSTNDYINDFSFNTLVNSNSGCNGVAPNYQLWAQTTSVLPGNTYSMTVHGSTTKPNGFGVWIDYNRDLDFLDAGEFVYFTPGAYGSLPTNQFWTTSITIPTTATPGITRLRVRGNWQNYRGGSPGGPFIQSEACGLVNDWVETEDYNITIIGSSVVLPPIANFFPSQPTTTTIPTDTVWLNSPYELVSTSTNATRAFWDLPGETNLAPGYTRQNVAWTTQQYIDTAKYNQKFKYTFNRRGFWPVRLLAVNSLKRDSLRDSVQKYIYVDTPGRAPTPNFFSARRKVGIADMATFIDISMGGPNQWYWTFDPPCNLCNVPPYFNNYFAGPTDQNPYFFGGDPGKYTVCLMVWNVRGWDSICKKDYIEVLNSINMCSGSGAERSSLSEGYVFGPSGPGLSYTRSQLSGCNGFLLEPCADSIRLWVERIKMLPTDTLVVYNGSTATAPILAKLGAANVYQLPAPILQNGIKGGSRLFLKILTGSGSIPTPYDSAGFSIRWEIKAASYPKPTSKMNVQDTIFSNQPVTFTATSTGTLMKYSWDTDGNGTYDSVTTNPTRTFLVTVPNYKTICLSTYNCVGSDTVCKNVLFLPTTQKPTPRFTVNKLQGFNTDTFRFTDQSLYGPSSWKWTFTPGTAQFLLGTTPTSKNPVIRFTQRTKYTVKLVVTNIYGSDSLIKVDYVNIGAYDQPQCLTDINLADGSIGISRVKLDFGVDTMTNAYTPCYQLIGGNQSANMYRGKKHALTVVRPSTTSPMDRKAWIDFNMDGMFTNDELVMSEMNAYNLSKTDTIQIASNQMLGSTRMRVGVTYAGTSLNSSVTFLGGFRDYVVNFPMDTVKPDMVLKGSNPYYTEIHKAYVDPGVVALDNLEGDISLKYEILGTVDTSKVGPNYLRYIVRDMYGNISDTLNRTVFVVLNQTGPSLTLNPPLQQYVEVFNKFNEPGYVAKNNQGADITSLVVVTSNLDTSKLGLYSVTYTVTDAFGMTASSQRAVQVGDTTRPVITPIANPYIQQVGSAIDLTKVVSVTDNYWGKNFIDVTIQGSVDVNNVGTYYISYVARDNSGNVSNLLVIPVIVKDTKAPTITLNDVDPLDWKVNVSFVDPGVTVRDNYWPTNTIVVSKKSNLNVYLLGEYKITYYATDPSGNVDSLTRVVKVKDTEKPRIDLLGVYDVNLPRWAEYVDAPIAIYDNYNSEAQLKSRVITINNLPINITTNKPWGDAPGLYSVRYSVTDLSGNKSDEAVRNINVLKEGPAGIEVMNVDKIMSVYPNPSNGIINLRLAGAMDNDLQITVLDMLGREVTRFVMKKDNLQSQEINLTQQTKGIYFLRVQSGDQVYSKKLQIN